MAALLQHMRLVVITALGCPVDPDVSRNLTIEFDVGRSVRVCGARGILMLQRIER